MAVIGTPRSRNVAARPTLRLKLENAEVDPRLPAMARFLPRRPNTTCCIVDENIKMSIPSPKCRYASAGRHAHFRMNRLPAGLPLSVRTPPCRANHAICVEDEEIEMVFKSPKRSDFSSWRNNMISHGYVAQPHITVFPITGRCKDFALGANSKCIDMYRVILLAPTCLYALRKRQMACPILHESLQISIQFNGVLSYSSVKTITGDKKNASQDRFISEL